ncbi:MAG: type III pantothenate kinase [Mycobacteriaceae bacterium]
MLLAIDIRNTHTSLGLFGNSNEESKPVQRWKIRTDPLSTSDELALMIRGLLGDNIGRLKGLTALCTVPSVLRELRVMLDSHWAKIPGVVVEPGVRTGVPLLVDNPKEVGADRIVNSLAAFHKYGTPCITVDCGSSTCIDVVSAKGEFLGGAIAPGIEASTLQLASQSAALRQVELIRPRSVVGKNTVECMQSGAIFGFTGMVDGIIDRIRAEVAGFSEDNVSVIATGDMAPLIVDESDEIDYHEPDLTLEGLQMVFRRNSDSERPKRK